MKRITLITVMLLGSVAAAHADRDFWTSTSGHLV